MKPEKISAAIAQQEAERSKKKIQALERQLKQTVEALERTRRTPRIRIDKPKRKPRINGDKILMTGGDLHGMCADRPSVDAFLTDVKAIAPHHIILMGDMVNCGGFLAQHHVLGYVAETGYSYEEDVAFTNAFLDRLQEVAGGAVIEFIEGNHERRVETWCVTETLRHGKDSEYLRRSFAPEFLLQLKQRGIPYFRTGEFYDGLPVPGVIKRGSCYYFHGFSTAKNAAATTQAAVSGNCVFAHTHRHQADVVRRVSTGEIGAWNPGCLCGRQPLWQHGKPTDWTNGFSLQLISRTKKFLHLNVPIIDGASHLSAMFKR